MFSLTKVRRFQAEVFMSTNSITPPTKDLNFDVPSWRWPEESQQVRTRRLLVLGNGLTRNGSVVFGWVWKPCKIELKIYITSGAVWQSGHICVHRYMLYHVVYLSIAYHCWTRTLAIHFLQSFCLRKRRGETRIIHVCTCLDTDLHRLDRKVLMCDSQCMCSNIYVADNASTRRMYQNPAFSQSVDALSHIVPEQTQSHPRKGQNQSCASRFSCSPGAAKLGHGFQSAAPVEPRKRRRGLPEPGVEDVEDVSGGRAECKRGISIRRLPGPGGFGLPSSRGLPPGRSP